jgi:hypothetical protein
MAERRDLLAGFGVALLALALALAQLGGPVQALVGIPFALFVPGYAIVAALFAPGTIGAVERAVASVAAALAALVLCSVVLDALGIRLDADAFAVALTVVTVVASGVAVLRGRPRVALGRPGIRTWLQGSAVLLAVLAAVAFAFSLAQTPRSARGVTGYATLSATRSGQAVSLEIDNGAPARSAYRLVMMRGSAQLYSDSLRLKPGTRWSATLTAPGPGTVTITLYRDNETAPIRTLTLPS